MAKKKTDDHVIKCATSKPDNLAISRNGLSFTCTWKIKGSDYKGGQQFQYRYRIGTTWQKWISASVSTGQQQKAFKLADTLFYPTKGKGYLTGVEFRVKGKQKEYKKTKKKVEYTYKPKYSDWANKTMVVSRATEPYTPTFALDETFENKGTFSWTLNTSTLNAHHFTRAEWQYVERKDFNDADLSKAFNYVKASGTATANGSTSQTISSSITADASYSAVFRIREIGAGGYSAWRYTKHVYAIPYNPSVQSAEMKTANGITQISAKWWQPSDYAHPVDSMECQYAIDTPDEGLTPPSGVSWNSGQTVVGAYNAGATFNAENELGLNQCLWVRVKANHDKQSSYSKPFLAKCGKIVNPTLSLASATTDTTITVHAKDESGISDAWILVSMALSDDPSKFINIGMAQNDTDTVLNCPNVSGKSYTIAVRTVVGEPEIKQNVAGYAEYSVTPKMESDLVVSATSVLPSAPSNLTAVAIDTQRVRLAWDWNWDDSNEATISWAKDADAWESTESPSSYDIDHKVSSYIVAGLDEGSTYYFKVQTRKTNGNTEVSSPWSELVEIDMGTTPTTPSLATSEYFINEDNNIYFTVGYSGSGNFRVEVAEYEDGTVGDVIVSAESSKELSTTIEAINVIRTANGKSAWVYGLHSFVARVTAEGGHASDNWSAKTDVMYLEEPSITSVTSSLVDTEITSEDTEGQTYTESIPCLLEMPLTVTVVGAGTTGQTEVKVVRFDDFHAARPDESKEDRFAGEVVAVKSQTGEDAISFELDDLIGRLDDGAFYRIECTITDTNGQTASQNIERFLVKWTHQPELPTVTYLVDEDNMAVQLTASKPASYAEGDVIDIYRLSADRPELILAAGSYDTTYVDPYPAFGEYGGYRIVAKTANGDYVASDNTFAWADVVTELDSLDMVIDFDGYSVNLPYNITFSNSWKKDFNRTVYLGGSIAGDWNPGITRDLSANSVAVSFALDLYNDLDTLEVMRRLATYAEICHVRMPDGSSFAADVQVSESRSYDKPNLIEYGLNISAVDPEGFDAMTLEDWKEMQGGA